MVIAFPARDYGALFILTLDNQECVLDISVKIRNRCINKILGWYKISLRKECGYDKRPLPGQIFHSVMNQFDDSKGKLVPKIAAYKTQCILDLFLDKNNLINVNKAESQDNLIKLAYLYEISRAIQRVQSINEHSDHRQEWQNKIRQ